jgi:hypothetical protein
MEHVFSLITFEIFFFLKNVTRLVIGCIMELLRKLKLGQHLLLTLNMRTLANSQIKKNENVLF